MCWHTQTSGSWELMFYSTFSFMINQEVPGCDRWQEKNPCIKSGSVYQKFLVKKIFCHKGSSVDVSTYVLRSYGNLEKPFGFFAFQKLPLHTCQKIRIYQWMPPLEVSHPTILIIQISHPTIPIILPTDINSNSSHNCLDMVYIWWHCAYFHTKLWV